MNDLDLCLEVVSRSRQPLRYIRRWISRKPLEIEAWFQRTTNRKWHVGYRMVTWPMTSRDFERSNSWPQFAESAISRKLLELETSNLVHGFVWRMTSRHTKISPQSGRGLGHVTPTIFGITVGYPTDSLASCFWFLHQISDTGSHDQFFGQIMDLRLNSVWPVILSDDELDRVKYFFLISIGLELTDGIGFWS